MLVSHGCQTVQLVVAGGHVLEAPFLLTDLMAPRHPGGSRLTAMAALHGVCARRTRARPRSAEPVPSPRLDFVLRALDGDLAGASQRQIAVALFGPRRVETEWRDPGGYIRDRVRRAIRRGRRIMTSGYLELLRR
ncbi:MAG: DUF2285 domain-containing protein [Dongiaceae bacterium]